MSVELTQVCSSVMERVPHGVAVLTLVDDAGVHRGMTVSSLTSASAEPPSVLVCIRTKASMHPFLKPGRRVGISVLGPDQSKVSNGFAYGADDPFAVFGWHHDGGVPVVDGTMGHLVGTIDRVVDNHDTSVVIVAVSDGAITGDAALVHWNRGYYSGLVPAAG
jgi:flavin reductase (DIM6/NTAB) family NADH-FMN oxidoreductase RutF